MRLRKFGAVYIHVYWPNECLQGGVFGKSDKHCRRLEMW